MILLLRLISATFQLIGLILAAYILLLAIFKVPSSTFQWYALNLLGAFSITSVFRILTIFYLIQLKHNSTNLLDWLQGYIPLWSLAVARLILLFAVLEVYTIYSFNSKWLSAIFQRKWLPHVLIHCFAQLLSLPAILQIATPHFFANFDVAFAHTYNSVLSGSFIAAIIVIAIAIATVCRYKAQKNSSLIKRLTPMIFYFIPITIVDAPISVAAAFVVLIPITPNVFKALRFVVAFSHTFQLITVTICTIAVMPSLRNATLSLLGIRKKNNKTAVIQVTCSRNQASKTQLMTYIAKRSQTQ